MNLTLFIKILIITILIMLLHNIEIILIIK